MIKQTGAETIPDNKITEYFLETALFYVRENATLSAVPGGPWYVYSVKKID